MPKERLCTCHEPAQGKVIRWCLIVQRTIAADIEGPWNLEAGSPVVRARHNKGEAS